MTISTNLDNEFKDEWTEEIFNFLKSVIIDEIGQRHQFELYFNQTLYQGKVRPSIPMQFYYDKLYRRAYIKYDIDWLTKQKEDWQTIYRKINTRIINNFEERFHAECYILGATNFYSDPRIPQGVYETETILPTDCITYWRTFDERSTFICNHNQVVADKINYLKFGGTEDKIKEFNDKVLEINKKYDFVNNNREAVESGFEEYAALYKEYFGKQLKAADSDSDYHDLFYIYFDVYYDEVLEQESEIE